MLLLKSLVFFFILSEIVCATSSFQVYECVFGGVSGRFLTFLLAVSGLHENYYDGGRKYAILAQFSNVLIISRIKIRLIFGRKKSRKS